MQHHGDSTAAHMLSRHWRTVVGLGLRGLVGEAVVVKVIVVLFSHTQVPPCTATFMLIELWFGAGTLFPITRIEHVISTRQAPRCTASGASNGGFTSADEAREAQL